MLLAFAGLLIFILISFSGCASSYGSLKQSTEITDLFENHVVLADHTYYYSGFLSIPYAIVAIDNQYTLRSSVWRQLRLTSAELRQLTYRMQSVYQPVPTGAIIFGPGGERLGIWYCSERTSAVKLNPDNSVTVTPPLPPELRGIP
jgi:hypothetical protein